MLQHTSPATPCPDPLADARRLSVAPMMDWTDRHCRFLHRLIAPRALLYTEMITTGAILHGDRSRLLDFSQAEQPVALQLGGSEPNDLARAARVGEEWGYSEINLNCGCPSERVQQGAFGACLMREPDLVAHAVAAMQAAVKIPVTVKHRIGVDDQDDFEFVARFVERLFAAGCRVFIVHARSAILKGLSPKENREIPPLRGQIVRQLKAAFPLATFVGNGGLKSTEQALEWMSPSDDLPGLDGVMLGRAAYHDPWILKRLSQTCWAETNTAAQESTTREAILPALEAYFEAQLKRGVPGKAMGRHWHGLFHGQPGARHWRREISEGESPMAIWRRYAFAESQFAPATSIESRSQPAASHRSVDSRLTTRTRASQA